MRTPSYALHIAQGLREAGIDPAASALEIGMFGAEPWTEAMRDQIERELGLGAVNVYGLSEIVGPGVAAECPEARDGLHVQEDHFLVEVVDPDTGEPVADGAEGELVFTTLTKEAMPLLRYRTGDIASLDSRAVRCGRTFARMARLRGRRDDMLIVRGVNLYPSRSSTCCCASRPRRTTSLSSSAEDHGRDHGALRAGLSAASSRDDWCRRRARAEGATRDPVRADVRARAGAAQRRQSSARRRPALGGTG